MNGLKKGNNPKAKLMEAPSLTVLDFNKNLMLYADCSFVGIGAALHQKHVLNGKEV